MTVFIMNEGDSYEDFDFKICATLEVAEQVAKKRMAEIDEGRKSRGEEVLPWIDKPCGDKEKHYWSDKMLILSVREYKVIE